MRAGGQGAASPARQRKLTLNASRSAMQSLLLLLEKFTLFLETGNSVTRLQ